jgi:hypothetical protein
VLPNPHFVKINKYIFHSGKELPKISAVIVIKKLPKANNHPKGEHSPNPVTLITLKKNPTKIA